MKKAKQGLAVLMVMALLCGFAAFGVSAADAKDPAPLTDAQMAELMGYMNTTVPLAVLELALQRVPGWFKWAVFEKGSSYAIMEAELIAGLKKEGYDFEALRGRLLAGEIMVYAEEALGYNKVMAEKGPDIIKKHCLFYVDWLVDCIIWANKLTGAGLLFA